MVSDWKYDYGANDRECSTILLWIAVRLNPVLAAKFDLQLPDRGDEMVSMNSPMYEILI